MGSAETYQGMHFIPILAEAADAAVTLPWPVWSGIGAALVTALVWVVKTWKASVEQNSSAMVGLVREVVAAVTTSNATLAEVLEALKDIRRNG